MDIPAGAVEEVEVVGDFDETDAALDEPAGEEAALAELAAVFVAEGGGLAVEGKGPHELGAGQALSFADELVVVLALLVAAEVLPLDAAHLRAQVFATRDATGCETSRRGE